MTGQFDLNRDEKLALGLIQELRKARAALADAMQSAEGQGDPPSAPGSSTHRGFPYAQPSLYGSGAQSGAPTGYSPGVQSGVPSGYSPPAPRSQAEGAIATASAHVEQIRSRLSEIHSKARQFLVDQRTNIRTLASDQSTLEASPAALYSRGQRAAEGDIPRCERLLRSIEAALAQDSASPTGPQSIDQTVSRAHMGARIQSPSPSGLDDVTEETISRLDSGRYGWAGSHTAPQYPQPLLGSPGGDRHVELSDKVVLGLGGAPVEDAVKYVVPLPACHSKISKGFVAPEDLAGRYTVRDYRHRPRYGSLLGEHQI